MVKIVYKQYNHVVSSPSSGGIEISPKLLGTANIDPIQSEEIQCIPVKGSGQLELREGFQIVLLLLRLRTSPESFFFQ